MAKLPAAVVNVCDPTWCDRRPFQTKGFFARPAWLSNGLRASAPSCDFSATFSTMSSSAQGPSHRGEPEGREHEHAEREVDCREHPGRGIIEDQPIEPVADEIARVAGLAAL